MKCIETYVMVVERKGNLQKLLGPSGWWPLLENYFPELMTTMNVFIYLLVAGAVLDNTSRNVDNAVRNIMLLTFFQD